ncbi:kinase-like domain-containing protein [Mycena olivaceomarginata]|nr:kinase-like domain-containing protein [Mycena olivaceomarginata]
MQEEDVAFDEMEQTQEDPVIQTQPDSQSTVEDESELWGRLTPCLSQTIAPVTLVKTKPEVTFGRNSDNEVIFPGFKISNFHAIIVWNGLENAASVITILDKSSNGTFVRVHQRRKIGKGQQRLLKDGNEVSFGVCVRSTENNGLYDYRFIFRDLVSSVEKRALFNSYDLSIELGKGSFATVYKALHRASGEWVAVKVIHETKRAGQTAAQASSREINVMEHLRHPNICQLREVFWNANGSIGRRSPRLHPANEGLSEDVTKHIVYQLCQALAYIHEKGITHRDLKPENVLLTLDDPPIVKVADFGLAKIVDSMTMLKTMCGTPSYLAPEVVTQQNSSGYDSLVDSWSVGVIMFSMLSNTTPFIESSVEDLRTRIAERIIEWTQLERLRLSEDALDFLRRLLEYDPRYRMKLSEALEHPWLKDYVFAHPIEYPSRGASSANSTSSLSQDVSMRTADQLSFTGEAEAVSQGFEHLKLNGSTPGIPAAANGNVDAVAQEEEEGEGRLTPSSTPPGLTLHKKGGLQRRADVLQQAEEAGQAPIEPSWEMVTFAQSQGQSQESDDLYRPASQPEASNANANTNAHASGSSTSGSGNVTPTPTKNANGKGLNKRVHSELTPLPEEMDGQARSEASSPLSSLDDSPRAPVSGPLRKKGRSAEDAPGAGTPSKTRPQGPSAGRRGRRGTSATTTTTRKVKAKVDSGSEDQAQPTPMGTRRSTRTKIGKR